MIPYPPHAKPKPSKYRNQRTEHDGILYDSRKEAKRAQELDLLKQAGQIRGWTRQVKFRLGCPENVCVIDFLVFATDGTVWAEDTKGKETSKFVRDKKLWRRYGPCPLHVLKGRRDSYVIDPGGEE
ncbi:MAG: DUF1064 domain-containing protein [Phycisphaerales bacterium]